MPFTEYRQTNYALGTLVIGALGAGFFLLFGPTVFALKLTPLLLSTLALIFWYWTIRRAAGKRVAGYFAMLFCFSPPLFTAYSVATLGTHSESIVFSALTLFLLFRMLSEEKPSLAYPLLLGLIAGFGLWFAYIYGLTLMAMLGFWLWYDKGKFWRPRVLWFALGFTVGFSPWIIINAQNHFGAVGAIDHEPGKVILRIDNDPRRKADSKAQREPQHARSPKLSLVIPEPKPQHGHENERTEER